MAGVPDPNEKQVTHRGGYGDVDIDNVMRLSDLHDGNGIRPREVQALVAEVRSLRETLTVLIHPALGDDMTFLNVNGYRITAKITHIDSRAG